MPLNESVCQKATPREKNYDRSRYWQMNYREEGKQLTASFGVYPQVSLSDARIRMQNFRARLKEGS